MAGQMTWGQLKEKFKGMPDNTIIVSTTHNSMELGNAIVDAYATHRKMKLERRDFVDAFDHTRYSKEIYRPANDDDEEAVDVIYVGG